MPAQNVLALGRFNEYHYEKDCPVRYACEIRR